MSLGDADNLPVLILRWVDQHEGDLFYVGGEVDEAHAKFHLAERDQETFVGDPYADVAVVFDGEGDAVIELAVAQDGNPFVYLEGN